MKNRRLYLCTGDREDLEDFIKTCIAGGVDIVQLREKSKMGDELFERAKLAMTVCKKLTVPFFLNDDPAMAKELGADGVHVGQEDMNPSLVRAIVGDQCLIGLSTHGISDLEMSIGQPVDYISAGPIEPTPTKPGRQGTGLAYVEKAVLASHVPVFVTGGINPDTIGPVLDVGVKHFVVVRYLTESKTPKRAAKLLRSIIDGHLRNKKMP